MEDSLEWTKTSMVRVLLTLFHRHDHRGPFVPVSAEFDATRYTIFLAPNMGPHYADSTEFLGISGSYPPRQPGSLGRTGNTPEDCVFSLLRPSCAILGIVL